MNTHVEKAPDKQHTRHSAQEERSQSESDLGFADNRSESVRQRQLQNMANNATQSPLISQLQRMSNGQTSALNNSTLQLKDDNTGSIPQAFCIDQPHSGELAAFCGYYALCNYMGKELDLEAFRKIVYTQYSELGLPEDELPAFVAQMGTGMEGIAVNNYGFAESSDAKSGIAKGRFMAATNRYGGHWLTYIKDDSGNWWEYDSWLGDPSSIGSAAQLQEQLKTDGMSNIYYK